MDFDIDIDGWPADVEWDALTVRAHAALCGVEPALGNPRLTASVLFTSDADVHALNKEWRGKDKPTNVLSFPMLERADLLDLAPEGPPEMLGDLALAAGTCARGATWRVARIGGGGRAPPSFPVPAADWAARRAQAMPLACGAMRDF